MSIECRYPNGVLSQTATEERSYPVDVTEWCDSPTAPVVDAVYDETSGTNVMATVMTSTTPSVTNATILLPKLRGLTEGRNYRIEFHFTGDNSDRLELHARVRCIP